MVLIYEHYAGAKRMYRRAAAYVRRRALEAIRARGSFHLAMAGGATPQPLYRLLSEGDLPWDAIHLYWSDERVVPVGDRSSNMTMADTSLLARITMPPENIHRVPLEYRDPHAIAQAYEDQMRPCDLVLLGMGEEGHTASLFPGDPALGERSRRVVAVGGERGSPPVPRITFTLPFINSARAAIFLVAGARKMRIVNKIIEYPAASAQKYPAAMVQPRDELVWYTNA